MIGKCNTGGGENLTAQLNNQDAIITELEAKVQSVSGVDMATPVNAQTLTIEQIQESLVGKAQGANATADKILEGYSAYVGQELVNGTARDLGSQIDFGEITVASKVTSVTVEHNLGVKPKLVFVVPFGASKSTPESVNLQLFSADSFCDTPIFDSVYRVSTNYSSAYGGNGSVTPVSEADESQITFKSLAAAVYFQGTYKWFAMT